MESSRSADRYSAWVVLVVFLVLTALATRYVEHSSQAAVKARFDNAVQTTRDSIKGRLETYINVLTAASSLFAAEETVTQDEFRDYVRHLDVQRRYPGIQGVGLSLRIPADRVEEVVQTMRSEGFPEFRIWPPSSRSEHHAIIVLEPLDQRNRAALGYDMSTSDVRRVAMNKARDSGQPTASGLVRLVQEIDPNQQQPGFLIYVPIYTTRATPQDVEQRRETLYGYVYAPFRAHDLFSGLVEGQRRPELAVSIYDGDRTNQDHLLYATANAKQAASSPLSRSEPIPVAGRTWTLRVNQLPPRGPSLLTWATLAGGVLFSLLLFALVRVQTRARETAEATAERLRASEAQLQEANRAKDEFLATLSHELRTPMTAIIGWANLLADDLDEETNEAAIDAIQRASRAQAQLIDDLLDVSRITAGKMRIEPHAIELAPVLRAAIDSVTPAAEAKGLRVDADLPSKPVIVSGDANRLQQVVWNLMSNAVKFTPSGGSVRVSLRQTASQAVIEVADSGQGIDPEFLPHVFERFRQADSSTTRAYTGLGLGLAIVRHLVEMHGGEVSAFSEGEGRGATFRVALPLLAVRARAAEEQDRGEAVSVEALRNVRVLVVDDEETVRNYAGAVFRSVGAEVRCVSSAEEALRLLERWSPEVILSDLGMPVVDGYELLRRIRENGSSVPVIALTAYARPEDRDRALRAGFTAYVAKPVEPAELRQHVADVLPAAAR